MKRLVSITSIALSVATFFFAMYLFYMMMDIKPQQGSLFVKGAWWSIKICFTLFMAFRGWTFLGEKISAKMF